MNSRHTFWIAIAALLTTASVGWPAEPWTELPSLPEGLAGFAVRSHGRNVQVAGGTTWTDGRKSWSNRIMELDESEGRWRTLGSLPYSLAYGGSMADDEGWWLLGGHNDRESSREALCLNAAGEVVRRSDLSSRWRFARGTALEGKGYFVVRQEIADESWEGAFLEINPKTGAAVLLAALPNAAWVLPAVSAVDGHIVVAGGASLDPASGQLDNRAEILIFDPRGCRWSQWGVLPRAVRGMAAVALDSQQIFLAGGFSGNGLFQADGYILDLVAGRLARTSPLPTGCMPELVRIGDWLYSIGGEDAPRSRSRSVFRTSIRDLIVTAEIKPENHEPRSPR